MKNHTQARATRATRATRPKVKPSCASCTSCTGAIVKLNSRLGSFTLRDALFRTRLILNRYACRAVAILERILPR